MTTEQPEEDRTNPPPVDAESTGAPAGAGAEATDSAAEATEQPPAEQAAPDPLEGKSPEEIEALAAEGAGYLELAQRTRADFDNYRKRTQRDLAAAKVRGAVDLAREIATALDNIERALEHESDASDGSETSGRLIQALRTAQADVLVAMERNGITPIAAAGQVFDPNLHEAIARRPAEEGEQPGTCVVVYQTGYAAGDEVVRASRVVVAD